MKKKILTMFVGLIIIPTIVNANIICNDGTVSPSCGDCHRGCCSHHGGCSNSYSSNRNIPTPTPKVTPTPIATPEPTKTAITNTPYSYTKTNKKIDEEEDNDLSSIMGGLIALGGASAGIYALKQKKKENKI